MSNLACLLKARRYFISGSDIDTFGPSAELLKQHNINYFKDHNSDHIKKFKPDMVIIGNAMKRGNQGLEYILNERILYKSMPEAIRESVIDNKKSIVVAGTSGKTTVTALIAWILHKANLKPTALVGGTMKNTGSGFINGSGEYAVIEGDEYGSSFYDPSPKFIHYRPTYSVINNIQEDHLDIYGNLENILKTFKKLVQITPRDGFLILNKNDGNTSEIIKEARSKIITFGENGDIWPKGIRFFPEGISFVVFDGSRRLGEIRSSLLGKHNAENISAAIALGISLKIPFRIISQALADFKGIKRRLEIIHKKENLTIIDDFAHNPDKVSASLSALRNHFPKHQIIAIFEPRTGSSSRNFFQKSYIRSFEKADLVYIADPFKKSDLNKKEVFSSQKLARDLNQNNIEAYAFKTADDVLENIKKRRPTIINRPSVIVAMSSGEFDNIHSKLVKLFS